MKKTKGLQVLQALNDIDDKMVDEAMPSAYRRRRTFVFTRRMTVGLLAVAAAVVLAIVLPQVNMNHTGPSAAGDSSVLGPSGIDEYASLAEAESAAGFEMNVPDNIGGVTQSGWFVMGSGTDGVILEVVYGEDVTVRKGTGTEDISGDYNVYDWQDSVDGIDYAGADEQSVSLVTWTSDSYSYSISYGTPVSLDQAQADAASIS